MKTIATLLASVAFSTAATAGTVVGLADDKTLVMIDTDQAAVTTTLEVEGVNRLHGIDYRPSNGTLIGVTDEQVIVTIDPETGMATELSRMEPQMEIASGTYAIVDVNPVADRLRFMADLTNHRVNMDTGEATADGDLHWAEGDDNEAADLRVAATGYSNSYGAPEETAMYNIDTDLSLLLQQTAPNEGVNATIGDLGVDLTGPVGFDIGSNAEGANTAWLAALGGLHTVDLETGAVLESWEIEGLDVELRDITVWPAM